MLLKSNSRFAFGKVAIGTIKFILIACLLAFLIGPMIVIVLVSFNPDAIVLPPEGFTLYWYSDIFNHPEFLSGIKVSLLVALSSALLSSMLGILSAIALTRYHFRGREAISMFLLSPLLIPVIIISLALFQFCAALGLAKSFLLLVIGHVVMVMPYPMRSAIAMLTSYNMSMEEAVQSVGGTRIQAFFLVTLPHLKSAIIGGFISAFVLSWNNYAISLFLASPDLQTLPIRIHAYIEYEYKPVIAALSTILILSSGIALLLADKYIGISGMSKQRV